MVRRINTVVGFLAGCLLIGIGHSVECKSVELQETPLEADHFPNCSELEMKQYPPMGGSHYGIWAAYKEYSQPIAPGFWLHNLEHGGVVILYHCPQGCPDQLGLLRSLIAQLPAETPTCPGTERRAILAPDVKMEPGFAVLAWGHALVSNCVDSAAYQAFMSAHFRQAPEDICSSGRDVLAENLCPQSFLGNVKNRRTESLRRGLGWAIRELGHWRMDGSKRKWP